MFSSKLSLLVPLSFLLAFGFCYLLKSGFLFKSALDHPNHRSLHTKPVARTGGLAIMTIVLLSLLVISKELSLLLIPSVLLLVVISLIDDLYDIPVILRFFSHFIGAWLFILALGIFELSWFFVIALLAIVWMINLYNFMDGADGLAGGMTFFGFGTYAFAAWVAGDFPLALFAASITSASLAFLFFNFNPAKIFMGDVGSIPLGFLSAAVGLYGWHAQLWPAWFPILIFSPFIVDATVTLFKRLLSRRKVWEAHREHYYQRLVRMGWGHKKTAIMEYGLMMALSLTGLLSISTAKTFNPLILLWIIIYGYFLCLIDYRWRKISASSHSV